MPMLFDADPFVHWPKDWDAPADVLTRKSAYRFVADGVPLHPVVPQLLSHTDADRLMQQLQSCRPVLFGIEVAGDYHRPEYIVAFSVSDGSIALAHFYSFRTKHERLPTAQTEAHILYRFVESILKRSQERAYCYVPLTLEAPKFTRVHNDGREEHELCSPDLDQRLAEGGVELFLKRRS